MVWNFGMHNGRLDGNESASRLKIDLFFFGVNLSKLSTCQRLPHLFLPDIMEVLRIAFSWPLLDVAGTPPRILEP